MRMPKILIYNISKTKQMRIYNHNFHKNCKEYQYFDTILIEFHLRHTKAKQSSEDNWIKRFALSMPKRIIIRIAEDLKKTQYKEGDENAHNKHKNQS
jgi:hypothetical protein